MPARRNLAGQRFGRWTVGAHHTRQYSGTRNYLYWTCTCDCGWVGMVRESALTGGLTLSCGCYQRDRVRECIASATLARALKRADISWTIVGLTDAKQSRI